MTLVQTETYEVKEELLEPVEFLTGEVNKTLHVHTGHTELSMYDLERELKIITKTTPDRDIIKNTDGTCKITFSLPETILEKYVLGKQIDFVGHVTYNSTTPATNMLSESVYELFDYISLKVGTEEYVVTRELLKLMKYRQRKGIVDMEHSFYKSLLWNGTENFYTDVERPFNFSLSSLTELTGVKTLFDLVLNRKELSSIEITFQLNKTNVNDLGDITWFQIRDPRLIYYEYEDLEEQPVFQKLWEEVKFGQSIKTTGVHKLIKSVGNGSRNIGQVKVPLSTGEQVKSIILRVFLTSEYEGVMKDREVSGVQTGNFKKIKLFDGVNGEQLFTKKEYDNTDVQLQYYLQKSNKSFVPLDHKDPGYTNGLLEVEFGTRHFKTLNTSYLMGTPELYISGEIEQSNGTVFSTVLTLEVLVEYEQEHKYYVKGSSGERVFKKLE